MKVYFAIPGHYTIGDSFNTWDEAHNEAVGRIQHFEDLGTDSREFIDVRVLEGIGDKSIARFEVFRDREPVEA